MQIVDDKQHAAMSFIAAANHGGHRPHADAVLEWITQPSPMPAQPGRLIKRGRPAKYRRVGGVSDSLRGLPVPGDAINAALAGAMNLSGLNERIQQTLASAITYNKLPAIAALAGQKVLVEDEIPDVYGPATQPETVIDCLVRLKWVDQDDRRTVSLTSLGRALLRSHETLPSNADAYDVVVLDSNNELSYPMLIRTLADAGDALLIDPYLRLEQLLAVKAYTSVTRVLISSNVGQQHRSAMAVLVHSGFDRNFELRVAEHGILHDRLIVGDDNVFTIGTSINTVGRQHPTVLSTLPDTAADTMRNHAENWWNDASSLASYPPEEEVDK